MRHRELSQILPALSELGVFTLVVTSGVIPIPREWMKIPAAARGGVGRRIAARPRCSSEAGHVCAHPQEYRRTRGKYSLGNHPADAAASRVSGRICLVLERAPRSKPHLGKRLHAANWGGKRRKTYPGGSSRLLAEELPRLGKALPEVADERGDRRGDPPSAVESRRLRFLENVRRIIQPTCEAGSNRAFLAGLPIAPSAGAPSAAGCTGSEGQRWQAP